MWIVVMDQVSNSSAAPGEAKSGNVHFHVIDNPRIEPKVVYARVPSP